MREYIVIVNRGEELSVEAESAEAARQEAIAQGYSNVATARPAYNGEPKKSPATPPNRECETQTVQGDTNTSARRGPAEPSLVYPKFRTAKGWQGFSWCMTYAKGWRDFK